jgi:hypothetical protein
MRATLVVRQNCVMECEKFCDKVLKDRNVMRKITSSENIHDMIVVKYSPTHSLTTFLHGFFY